jgi:tetratricopeptide (TPR) repeat protein
MDKQTPPLFNELWNYSDPAETEKRLRQLLSAAIAGADRSYHWQLLTQIARTHSLRMQFDEAHALLDEVEQALTDDLPVVRIRYLLERGRTLNSSKTADRGRALFEEAWQLGLAEGLDNYAVDAAHMLGIAGETAEQQHAWNIKAMALAEKSEDEFARKWLGALYNNIGWTYHDEGKFEEALAVFAKAVAFYEATGHVKPTRIAHWCVARTYRSLGRVEEALAIHQQQLEAYEADGEKPGYTYEEMGECLLALGRGEEARPFFGKAYEQLSQEQWLVAHEAARLQRLKALWQNDS